MAKGPDSYITAYFNEEDSLKKGLKQILEKGIPVHDVLTPFPVHGLDKLLKLPKSAIPKVGFIGGALGAVAGFGFQAWVFTKAWPINFGGKPYLSVPSFVPVAFECAILFAAFAMVFAFFIRSGLGPGAKNLIYDKNITDDRFLLVIAADGKNDSDMAYIKQQLQETGALGITVKK